MSSILILLSHIVTNEPENDPDIQHLPFFAVSTKFAKNLYSTYYQTDLNFDIFAKTFVPFQHRLYYVILAFGRFNLYVQSWMYVTNTKERVPYRKTQIYGMLIFWGWFSFLMSYLPSKAAIFAYVFFSHALTLVLHVQITLSHFGMSTEKPENETFAEMAYRTTLDVDCPRWMDWFHGGLQVT
jgi:delta8-fatty-acid desaturase